MRWSGFRLSYSVYVSIFLAGLPLLAAFSSFFNWRAPEDPQYLLIVDSILLANLVLMFFLFFEIKNYRNNLMSQNVLLVIMTLEAIYLLLTILSNNYLIINQSPAILFFRIANSIRDLQPLFFVYYVSLYIRPKRILINYFLAVMIFMSTLSLSLINLFGSIQSTDNFQTYVPSSPSVVTTLTIFLSFIIVGIFVISEIFLPRTIKDVFYKPLLANQYVIVFIGMLVVFFLSPILTYLPSVMGLQPTVTVFLAAKYLRTFGLVLLILPHFFGNDLPFGIIPQSVEKLVVMNSVGLPLLSYDFGYEERVLHSDLLVTSSLTAIVTYLTHSQILSTRLSSIKFEDRQLLFIIQEKLTFLIIVKKRTKIIDSALEVFTNAFIKVVPKDVADSGYLRPTFNQLIQDIRHSIIDQSFGSNYISSVEAEIQSQNQPDYGVFSMSRTIFSLVFAFSSLRLIYYIGSTLLIPEEGSLLLLLPALLYGSSIFIGPVLHQIFPITERRNFLLSLAIFFMIQLTTGPLITAVLIWSFALSSWNHLHTIWNSVFPRLSRQRRVHILILSLIMDMGLRAYNLGTDLSVSANTNPIFIIIAVTILLTFLAGFRDNSFDYPKEFAMGTKISFYVLAILIPINVRFTQNISQLLMFIDQPNILTYLSFGFVFLTILALSLQSKFLAWIRQHRSILIGFYFLPSVLIVSLHFQSYLSLPLILLTPLSYAFMVSFSDEEMPTKRVHDFVKRNWSFLMIAVPSIMFLVIIFTYYGFSMLYIIPLTLIIAAVNLFTVYMDATPRRLANKSSYSMIICFLFLSSLLMPFTVPLDIEDHDLRFGVMSYNVQYGINANNEYDPVTISEFISHSGVDVVGLQEVTRNSIINGNGDLLLQFIQGLKLHGFDYYVFMEGSSEVFTNVIFSRHPIIQSSSIHFWNNEIFQKGMITARIQVGENIINIGNTHLTHVYSGTGNTTRRLQTEQVLDYFDMTEPSILLGDFNVEPDDTDIQLIKERFSDGYQGTRGTWPSLDPVMRIDYVFHSGITPTQVEVIDVSYSDHLPVIAWFDL